MGGWAISASDMLDDLTANTLSRSNLMQVHLLNIVVDLVCATSRVFIARWSAGVGWSVKLKVTKRRFDPCVRSEGI